MQREENTSTCEEEFCVPAAREKRSSNTPAHLEPPDGGLRAWLVLLASFVSNGIVFGTMGSTGVITAALHTILEESGDPKAASKAALPASLTLGTLFILSIAAGILTDKLGIRVTTIVGGLLASLGFFLSSIFYTNMNVLPLTMGILFGTGGSLVYTPSIVILGHYFKKRLGIVNGIMTAGSSVFSVSITQLLAFSIEKYGLKVAFQILSGVMCLIVVCGCAFKPVLTVAPRSQSVSTNELRKNFCLRVKNITAKLINMKIWKNKIYVLWIIITSLAMCGYFVPYIHLIKFIELTLPETNHAYVVVQCMDFFTGIGKIAFGFVADKHFVSRIALQQLSFIGIGVTTLFLTAASKFWVFILIGAVKGLLDGGIIALLGPIVFDLVGPSDAPQAIGLLFTLFSIPYTLGPYLAGVLYDHFHNYIIPFLCAGMPSILGCFALCFVRHKYEATRRT